MPGIAPWSSCTWIRVESNAFFCWLPHQKYGPMPQFASSRTRFVNGDDQLICPRTLGWFSFVLCASGDAIRPVNERPDLEPPSTQCWQLYWTLIQPSIL